MLLKNGLWGSLSYYLNLYLKSSIIVIYKTIFPETILWAKLELGKPFENSQ